MRIKYVGRDANFTDGSNLSKMEDVYEVAGRRIRLPANLAEPANPPSAERQQALMDAVGLLPEDLVGVREGEALTMVTDIEINDAANLAAAKGILLKLAQNRRVLARRIRILEGD